MDPLAGVWLSRPRPSTVARWFDSKLAFRRESGSLSVVLASTRTDFRVFAVTQSFTFGNTATTMARMGQQLGSPV